jgi:hypothetical protein
MQKDDKGGTAHKDVPLCPGTDISELLLSDAELPMSVDSMSAIITAFLQGKVPIAALLTKLSAFSAEDMRTSWTSLSPIVEAIIRSRWASAATPEERVIYSVLWRQWPNIKAAAESLSVARGKHPGLGFIQLLERWLLEFPEPRTIGKLVGLLEAVRLEGHEQATNAAATEAIAFAKDLRALLEAADRIQNRWLTADRRDTPGGSQFRINLTSRFADVLNKFLGKPNAVSPSVMPQNSRLPRGRNLALPRGLEGAERVVPRPRDRHESPPTDDPTRPSPDVAPRCRCTGPRDRGV